MAPKRLAYYLVVAIALGEGTPFPSNDYRGLGEGALTSSLSEKVAYAGEEGWRDSVEGAVG
jgi:hypothetical protein